MSAASKACQEQVDTVWPIRYTSLLSSCARDHSPLFIVRSYTSAYVSIRQHTSAYVSQHTATLAPCHPLYSDLTGSISPFHLRFTVDGNPGTRAFFYFNFFIFLEGVLFFTKKWKKTLFSLCFSSLSLFLCTHTLSSFEFNQFHQSKLWRKTQKGCSIQIIGAYTRLDSQQIK